MEITTVGVDLAKRSFQWAMADASYRICRRERVSRTGFARLMGKLPKCQVVMEACGSSNYWARVIQSYGHEVKLLPAQHVRAYVRRSKTDAADAAALVEAPRSKEIRPVAVNPWPRFRSAATATPRVHDRSARGTLLAMVVRRRIRLIALSRPL